MDDARCYISTSDESLILTEQLAYLLNHASSGCKGCADCDWFREVRGILLFRFRRRKRVRLALDAFKHP